MEIGERIKEIRNVLNLNQSEFGQEIGVKQAAIGLYENSHRNITDRVISDICREFNVNENWLRYGEGEMFDELSEDEETAALIARLSTDDNKLKRIALKAAAKIIENDDCWRIIESEILKYINKKE